MQSWLDLLIESTKDSEAPERYFWWSGIAALSAVMRKRVYVQRGAFYKLYPNIYVALVSARSGLRKGIPISIVKGLLEELGNIRVISGCNSIQGLISQLSQQETFSNGTVIGEAQGILLSDEFESFIIDDPRALTYLTALHNTHEHEKEWKKRLKNSPLETLKSPCLSLLVASNEALFEDMVKKKDIEGGFIARTFIVYESRRRSINSLMYSDVEIVKILEDSSNYRINIMARLRQLSCISGKMIFDSTAINYYNTWYHRLAKLESDDNTGSIDRLGDQVIKVSMLVALSNHNELIINKEDLEIAIKECEHCILGVKEISMERKEGDINPIIEKILKVILKEPNQEITRQKLLNKTHVESLIIDRALDTLMQRGAISEPKRNSKKQIYYKMPEEVYKQYTEFQKDESIN